MAVAPQRLALPARLREGTAFAGDAFLHSYAQILLCRSRWVGLLLLAATAFAPRLMGLGALAVVTALGTALALGLAREPVRSGLYGYSALLVGLGIAALLAPGARSVGLVVAAAVVSVPVTAALHSALGQTFNLPALTLPFLFVFHLILAAAPLLGIGTATLPPGPDLGLPGAVDLYLRSLGAIFFLPRPDAGLMVLAALLFFSRIGFVLSLLGFAVAWALGLHAIAMPSNVLAMVLGYNFMLTAIALGGVWFVPSPWSLLIALVAVLVCGLITLGAIPLLARGGLPVAILPFNLTVILVLYAMRQRIRDARPKSVDFLLGSPEENLNHYRTRVARFGAQYGVRFRAPFLGRWVCTQGVDGQPTHQGPWRHGLDFEVAGSDGRVYRADGGQLRDYHCYRLPVVAAADGTVARVVDGVRDNPPGEVNLHDNWGNLVVLFHGPGLYSVVAHLAPGSIKVREGQVVRQSEQLGSCGSSGRSAVPHLHFQLQATARVGAPTLPVELHEVIREDLTGPHLLATCVPAKGETIRNLEPQPDVARHLHLAYGESIRFALGEGADATQEELLPEIDLYGNLLLRGRGGRGVLFYERRDDLFVVYDALGPRRATVHLLRAALPRVPLEANEELEWTDHLPRRWFSPAPLRFLADLVSPLGGRDGLELTYRWHRHDGVLEVHGHSTLQGSDGAPLVTTRAILQDKTGIASLSLTWRGRTFAARRLPPAGQSSPTPTSRVQGDSR